ncbi:MAG: hypothetical protein KDE50_22120, partial [Caldilineaceae bacterium]|nr:hypothetical protein [Caldilineaceae bacterium]
DVKSQLDPYTQDLAKAEELLTSVGFTRDSDGVWIDDQGNRMEYELKVAAEYADNAASAENAADQLTEFGIKTSVRGVNFNQIPIDVNEGNFQLAIRGWGAGNPHPAFSYEIDLTQYNAFFSGVGSGSGAVGSVDSPGMYFDLNVSTDSVGDVNLADLMQAA